MRAAALFALVVALEPLASADGECDALVAQKDRDRDALERQRKSIGAGLDELDRWTRENQEAQQKALHAAVGLLIDGLLAKFVEHFSEQLEAIGKQFEYEATHVRRVDPAKLSVIADLRAQRDKLQLIIAGATPLKGHGDDLVEAFSDLRTRAREAREATRVIAGLVEKIARDEALKWVLKKVALQAAASEFEKKWMDKRLFPFLDDAYDFGKAVVEYGYDAADWTASRARILQQTQLTDQQLEAVDVLHCQMERTVARLAECRGEARPFVAARCRKPAGKCGKPPFALPDACHGTARRACAAAIVAPCTRYLEELMAAHGKKVTRNDCAACSWEWAEELIPAQ